jgi:hypothetical protein
MKHRNSHLLVGYWSRLRKGRGVPDQTDIDPRAIKRVLSEVFILDASDMSRPLYRLAGTSHCDRYGAELKGTGFFAPWEAQSRNTVGQLLQHAMVSRQPICIWSLASSDEGGGIEIETVFAPVTFGGDTPTRFVGVSHVLGDASQLRGKPITFERYLGSEIAREVEAIAPAADGPPPPPPVIPARSFDKAPHLKLVVSRDKPVPAQCEMDAMMQRLIGALELAPPPKLRQVS